MFSPFEQRPSTTQTPRESHAAIRCLSFSVVLGCMSLRRPLLPCSSIINLVALSLGRTCRSRSTGSPCSPPEIPQRLNGSWAVPNFNQTSSLEWRTDHGQGRCPRRRSCCSEHGCCIGHSSQSSLHPGGWSWPIVVGHPVVRVCLCGCVRACVRGWVCVCVCVCVCLFCVRLSLLSIFAWLFVCLFVCLFVLFARLSVCLAGWLAVCLFICLFVSVCLSCLFGLFVCLLV